MPGVIETAWNGVDMEDTLILNQNTKAKIGNVFKTDVSNMSLEDIMSEILIELKKISLQMSILTDNEVVEGDIE